MRRLEARVNGTQKAEDLVYNEPSGAEGTVNRLQQGNSRTSQGSHCSDILKYTIFLTIS